MRASARHALMTACGRAAGALALEDFLDEGFPGMEPGHLTYQPNETKRIFADAYRLVLCQSTYDG